jgi:hypothetical protein
MNFPSSRRTIWSVDAHRDGKRFVVRAAEILTAFLELESAIHAALISEFIRGFNVSAFSRNESQKLTKYVSEKGRTI